MHIRLLTASLLAPFLAAQAPEHRLFDAPVLRAGATDEVELFGDVDGDGDVDLLACTPFGNTALKTSFRVLFNDGAGRFTAGASVPVPADTGTRMAFGDVTGDGLPDLVMSSIGSITGGTPALWLWRSTGAGTFAAPVQTTLPGNALSLHLGDADGNGVLDVLALHGSVSGSFQLSWFGDTSTGLAPLASLVLGFPSFDEIAVLRVDGDARTDVAMVEQAGLNWTVTFLQTTATSFTPSGTLSVGGGVGQDLVPGDWDQDGDDDLMLLTLTGPSQHSLKLLSNQGGGVFTAGTPQSLANLSISRLHPGDMDGDGDLDLFARGLSSSAFGSNYGVARIRNDGGVFSYSRFRTVPQTSLTAGAGLADLDGNGFLDFVDAKSVWFSRGDLVTPDLASTVALRDFDDDGDLDTVIAQELRRHDGAGAFATVPGFWPPSTNNEFYVDPIHVGDFDGDGATEVVAPWVRQIFTQQTFLGMRRLEANGDDQMIDQGSAAALPLRMNSGLVDDLDLDGDLDVLDNQGAWINDGTGLFAFTAVPLSGFRPTAKGDVDGDGDTDYLAVNVAGPTATAVLLRTQPLGFTVVVLSPAQGFNVEPQYAVLDDLDDDGDLDVACRERTASSQQRTLVFTNTAGVFTQTLLLPQQGRIAAGDVDLDGLTDLMVFEGLQANYLRRLPGPLNYAAPVVYAFGAAVDLTDLDQDGDLDIVGAALLGEAIPPAAAGLRRQYGTGGLGLEARRPLLSAVGPIRSGQPLSMRVRRSLGGSFGVLVFSAGSANVPNILPGLTAYVASIDAEFLLFLGGAPGAGGAGGADASFQLPPGTAGVTVYSQFVALDAASPSGLVHSNGVELRIGQ